MLYFEGIDKKNKDKFMLTCCKLKTMEYWVFRKLREKLKLLAYNVKGKKANPTQLTSVYTKETNSLCSKVTLPKGLKYYQELASVVFESISKLKVTTQQI